MRRRTFLGGLAGSAITPVMSRAQESLRPRRIALLASTERPPIEDSKRIQTFRQRLQELGYVHGRDYILEARSAAGRVERMPAIAQELVALRPDVIVAATTAAAIAAKQATSDIPIVGVFLSDPIRFGLIASHSHPAGNVTGNLITLDTLPGKHLELARDLLGNVRRVGLLFNVNNPSNDVHWRNAESIAATAKISLTAARLNQPDDIDTAIQHLAGAPVDAILVPPDAMLFAIKERLAALAIAARLPSIYPWREHVDAGGLASYGTHQLDNYRRAADFVDRIFKGTKPGDLPVELQTKFELVINLKTAKSLGIDIPPTLLTRADDVIE